MLHSETAIPLSTESADMHDILFLEIGNRYLLHKMNHEWLQEKGLRTLTSAAMHIHLYLSNAWASYPCGNQEDGSKEHEEFFGWYVCRAQSLQAGMSPMTLRCGVRP